MPQATVLAQWLLCAATLLAVASVECALDMEQVNEWHQRRQAHHGALHQQVHENRGSANFKNLSDYIQLIEPRGELDWSRSRESVQSEQETFQPFAAFRSSTPSRYPVVKVYVQAELHVIDELDCGFSKSGVWENEPVIIEKAHVTDVSLAHRRYTDYVLTCPDPGDDYTWFMFVRWNLPLKSIPINTTEPRQGGVGVCVGGQYSARQDMERWVTDMLDSGFSDIYYFYTHIQPTGHSENNWHFGVATVRPGQEFFQPYWHDHVHYIYYDSPSHSFDVGQLLVYNLCVQMNTPKHDFMAIVDPDEFFWRGPGPSQMPLTNFLSNLVGNKAAGATFERKHFPANCQTEPLVGVQSKMYWPGSDMEKTIVMTSRTQYVAVHHLTEPQPGFDNTVQVPTSTAYWKHVRHGHTGCDGLVDNETISTSS